MKLFNHFLLPIVVGCIAVVSVAGESRLVADNGRGRGDDGNDMDVLNEEDIQEVVSGSDAAIGEFPFFAALLEPDEFLSCGGVLIHTNWILTAAHCTPPKHVFVGSRSTSHIYVKGAEDDGSQYTHCVEYYPHPLYRDLDNEAFILNDFALCKLSSKLKYTVDKKPIRLNREYDLTGKLATVVGYGATNKRGNKYAVVDHDTEPTVARPWADILQKADLPLVSNEDESCGLLEIERPSNICAFAKKGDACFGDSGGPLFIREDGKDDLLVGIVSSAARGDIRKFNCEDPKFGGTYSRVSSAYDWIRETLCPKNNGANATETFCDILPQELEGEPMDPTVTNTPTAAPTTVVPSPTPSPTPYRGPCENDTNFRKNNKNCFSYLKHNRAKKCRTNYRDSEGNKKKVSESCRGLCSKKLCQCKDRKSTISILHKGKIRKRSCTFIKNKGLCGEKNFIQTNILRDLCPVSCETKCLK